MPVEEESWPFGGEVARIASDEGVERKACGLDDGAIQGHGQVRPCPRGAKIGPLFADTPEIAGRIYAGLAAAVPGQPLFIDVPEPNPHGTALAGRNGMVPVFGMARM